MSGTSSKSERLRMNLLIILQQILEFAASYDNGLLAGVIHAFPHGPFKF